MRTLDQIIAEQRSPAELEMLRQAHERLDKVNFLLRTARCWGAHVTALLEERRGLYRALGIIPAPPDAPGEEAAARRDRT